MQLSRLAKRRSFMVLLLFALVWAGLLLRLWWIQVAATHHFSKHDVDLVKSAVKQRQQRVILHSGRGDILDRNNQPFTGLEQQALIIFPLARGSIAGTDALKDVARIVNQPEQTLLHMVETGKEPTMLRDSNGKLIPLSSSQAEEINRLQIPGIVALAVTERYRADEVAKQVIGYINQNPSLLQTMYQQELEAGTMSLDNSVGAAGLELSFDRFLQGLEPSSLSYYVDGKGNPLRGLDIRYKQPENQFYPLALVTTMDRRIQQKLEQIADESGLKEGSIVVLDARTSDVVAMVSRPQYDQTRVNVNDSAWQNHALKQIPPGSVFKTVVAAAALGEGVVSPTERFFCGGSYGKFGFSCWNKEGHGNLTMEEAFAESCNITFAQIAKRVGGEKIDEYAKRLGMETQIGHSTQQLFKIQDFRQLTGEDPGRVFHQGKPTDDEGILIQTAIGQRDVRMTPLQAANLMATIANGGKVNQVRLVSDIRYRNGVNFYHFDPERLAVEGIDTATALKLKHMLQSVVETGTGKALQQAAWPVAGKSGTAQLEVAGEPRIDQWFVGYAPVTEPQYAIAVVAENQPTTAASKATQVFAKVVNELAAWQAQSSGLHAGNQP